MDNIECMESKISKRKAYMVKSHRRNQVQTSNTPLPVESH